MNNEIITVNIRLTAKEHKLLVKEKKDSGLNWKDLLLSTLNE